MNVVVSLILAFALVCPVAPSAAAEPRQVSQGTEIHLTLLTPINTSTAQEGDAITAVTSEPVVLGGLTILPIGTRLHGTVGMVQWAKLFSLFKGQGIRERQLQDSGSA